MKKIYWPFKMGTRCSLSVKKGVGGDLIIHHLPTSPALLRIPKGEVLSCVVDGNSLYILSYRFEFASSDEAEIALERIQRQITPSLTKRLFKFGFFIFAAVTAYIFVSAFIQAQDILSGKLKVSASGLGAVESWAESPDQISRALPSTAPQPSVDVATESIPLAQSVDQLLTMDPQQLPAKDAVAQNIMKQAEASSNAAFLSELPPSSSTSGLDEFGLAPLSAGCDPNLAFDKKPTAN